ncbi:hypothetical protein L596_029405 [Steinernema carpocapsae]|uniref:Abnormal cell migration protein 18-like fibronectin type I domain-containing protein n=1 Tax=Steinernema carpocapsae TaxID=34508 RepID=A0A4U5LUI5_STECR|nr:hypothetical protein L596_029405 [Steinernema carpocapsae]
MKAAEAFSAPLRQPLPPGVGKDFAGVVNCTMYSGALLLLAFAGLASGYINSDYASRRRCWSRGNNQPARWWNEGERIDRGKYWYECQNGELAPRGCFSNTNERLFVGGKFVQDGYETQCVLGSDGYLKFEFTGCQSSDGKTHSVGETWEDERRMYWFVCRQDGPYVKIDIGGCLTHDKSRRLNLGDSYDLGDYTYKCMKKYNGTIQMCSVGCIHQGVHYSVGQQWPDGDFLYYCKLNGGRCQKACVGCMHEGRQLYDGDRYHKDATVYQCEIRPDRYGHKPVGCVARDEDGRVVDKVIGCRWYSYSKNAKVEQTCELKDNKAVVKTVGCIYRHQGYDTLFLYPGTYTIWNQKLDGTALGVTCQSSADGQPSLDTFEMSELPYKTRGLKYDQPRG